MGVNGVPEGCFQTNTCNFVCLLHMTNENVPCLKKSLHLIKPCRTLKFVFLLLFKEIPPTLFCRHPPQAADQVKRKLNVVEEITDTIDHDH